MTSRRRLLTLVRDLLAEPRSVGRQASSLPSSADPRPTAHLGSHRQVPAPSGLTVSPAPGTASNDRRDAPSLRSVPAINLIRPHLCPYCRAGVVKPAYGHCGSDYCRDMYADAREASRELEQDRA